MANDFDIVIATIFSSMELIKKIVLALPHILPAYYVQDYEPLFFASGTDNWKIAHNSYTLIPGAFLFAKTHWIRNKVKQEHGRDVHKVEPSLDHEVYKPKWKCADGRIHIAAMIRPQTPRRGAERTMRILSKLSEAHPHRLAFHLFGCESNAPNFLNLLRDFEFSNYGVLKRQEVADLLGGCDVFVDFSDYQAFGRTALEAMACGCAVMVPVHGGTDEYAIDGVNALIVDSHNEEECIRRLETLVSSPDNLLKLRHNGLVTASEYSVHRAAVSEWLLLAHALANYRRVQPTRKRHSLLLYPSVRKGGLPSGSAYIRLLFPYATGKLLESWQVKQQPTDKLPEIGSADIVVIQREAAAFSLNELQIWHQEWRASKSKMIYELDDDLLDGPALRQRGFTGDTEGLAAKVHWLAAHADAVTVSTSSLAKKLFNINKKVHIIPNKLAPDLWRLNIHRDLGNGPFSRCSDGPIRIGYIGTPTHDQDLDIVTDAMKKIEQKYGNTIEIEVIGGFQYRPPTFGKRVGLPKNNVYPNFVDWLHQRVFWDIGIIPLVGDSFNQSKSNIKFLEYAALEMAIVCSDVPSYRDVAVHGVNSLVVQNTSEEWFEALNLLIENEELRLRLATSARQLLISAHTIDHGVEKHLSLLNNLIQ